MGAVARRWLAAAIVLAVLVSCVAARKVSVDVSRLEIPMHSTVLSTFGVEAGGVMRGHLRGTSPGQRAFVVLVPSQQWERWQALLQGESRVVKRRMCDFPSTLRFEVGNDGIDFSATVEYRNQYSVEVLACSGVDVAVTGEVSLINPSAGDDMQHLSVDQVPVATINYCLFATYATLLAAFALYCREQAVYKARIHWLFEITVVVKLLNLAFDNVYYHAYGATGDSPVTLALALAFTSTSDAVFLGALLLLAMGWTLTRTRLRKREYHIIAALVGTYEIVGVLSAVCTATGGTCGALQLAEYVERSFIMLGTIVGLNFSITHLRAAVQDGQWAPSLPSAYRHLMHFRQFRWAFLAYLLLPTVLLVIKITVLSWRFEWVSAVLRELLVLYIYVRVGVTFRPRKPLTFTDITNGNQAAVEARNCPSDGRFEQTAATGGNHPPHLMTPN